MYQVKFNVSQLLKAPTGEQRHYDLWEPSTDLGYGVVAQDVSGTIAMTRVSPGILVEVHGQASLELTCGRCLASFTYVARFEIEEMYRPSIDVITGLPLEKDPEVEDYLWIDHNHILDLNESIRQSIIVSIPIAPVCDESCKGLCPYCGKNLNEGSCSCHEENIDVRWEPLRTLLNQLN